MRTLGLLLRARWRGGMNSVRFATSRQKLFGGLTLLGGLLLFAGMSVGFGIFLSGVRQAVGEVAALALVRRIVSGLLWFLLAGGIPFLSHVLFSPGDLPLLGATPASPRAVMTVRLLEAAGVASVQFLILGLPALVAALWLVGTPWWGWPLAALFLLLFMALPAACGSALLLLMARLLGMRRVRSIVAVLSVALAVGVCLTAVSESTRFQGSPLEALQALGKGVATAPPQRWSPTAWVENALLGLGGKVSLERALGGGLLLVGLTGALGLCAVGLGTSLLGRIETGGQERTAPTGRADLLATLIGRLPLPRAVRGVVLKDFRYIARDLTLLAQLGVPLILYGVPFVLAPQASQAGVGRSELLGLAAFSVGVIAYMMCSILGLSSIGLEGRAFWLLKAAPLRARQLIAAKWWMAFLPTTLLTLALCLSACLVFGAEPWVLLLSLSAIPLGCGTLCGIEVGLSGIFPRFLFDNPAHRASVAALGWGFFLATAYALTALVPLVALVFGVMNGPLWLAPVSGTVFIAFSLACGYLPLRLAARHLESYPWEQ